MKQTLIQLAERREHLIARVAAQRVALADVIEPWRAPLALADQGLFALRFLKRHPVWIVGSVVLLAECWADSRKPVQSGNQPGRGISPD